MLLKGELIKLLDGNNESERIEFTQTVKDTDKLSETICAFANDLGQSEQPAYLILGVRDDGTLSGLRADDNLLQRLGALRSDGNILPLPSISIEKFVFENGDVVVIAVRPAAPPPVRYKGRIWVRVGARQAIASEADERILIEKRTAFTLTFDALSCYEATIEDLELLYFSLAYLPKAIAPEILAENGREAKQQLASLGFFDLKHNCPTYAGILLFGKKPRFYLPGAYIQYVKFEGSEIVSKPIAEKTFTGPLIDVLKSMEDFIRGNLIMTQLIRRPGSVQEEYHDNYPLWALRELIFNAVMHRDYQSNAPIYIYHFTDSIEIKNAGGLYGAVKPENFPNQSDYRNPILAEALKVLGYVNKFNYGIRATQDLYKKLNARQPQFNYTESSYFSVTLFSIQAPPL